MLFLADDIPELLSSSSLFSMLLPLIIAYIGPVAAAIPKVCNQNSITLNLLPLVTFHRSYIFPLITEALG